MSEQREMTGDQDRMKGLLIGLAGFALLASGDAVIKSIAGSWPGTAVAALRFAFGTAGLGVLLWWSEGREGFRVARPALHIGRGAALSVASLAFFLAIFIMPLTEAVAIQFTNPIWAALLSALFLGEPATRRGWIAILVAFTGVIIVLRPDIGTLGWSALLPVVAALGMASLMILNRKVAGKGSVIRSQFLGQLFCCPWLITAALAGHFYGGVDFAIDWPAASVILRIAVVTVTASFAHILIYRATTYASAATVAPTVYSQLIVALLLGWLVFDELPDAPALFGATLIIGSGIYLLREK